MSSTSPPEAVPLCREDMLDVQSFFISQSEADVVINGTRKSPVLCAKASLRDETMNFNLQVNHPSLVELTLHTWAFSAFGLVDRMM